MSCRQVLHCMLALGSTLCGHAALTWSLVGSPPADKAAAITSSMNTAVANFNTYANYSGNIPASYNAGVPTAQAGFQGGVEFGGLISARAAQHEIAHWLGTGTYSTWSGLRPNGQWTGAKALARLRSYDGDSAVLYADTAHFWPYGWNYDNEGPADRHIGMVGALRADMGLSDTTVGQAAGWYRLQNRATGKLVDNLGASANGANVVQWESSTSYNQKWINALVSGGYFKLYCATGGAYLDTLGHTTDGSSVGQWESSSSFNQQWSLVPTDSGYFKLVNRGNGKCLDTSSQTGNGAVIQNWACGSSLTQQWRFIQ